MDGIIEYIDVRYDREALLGMYKQTIAHSPLTYLECGAQSWIMETNPEFRNIWTPLLNAHSRVHDQFCKFATGFNYSETPQHTVPPHIDIDRKNYFNLLLPLFGVARLDIFATNADELEFRHGFTHWKMLKEGVPAKKIGSLLVDKPVLLNTDWLHSVQPEVCPRSVWCTRWVGVDETLNFQRFKNKVEEVLRE